MKIVVTGANSFIGNFVVLSLLKQRHKVYTMARRFNGKSKKNEIRIPINDYYDYTNKIPSCDVLIHCAWMGTTQDQRINKIIHKNNFELSLKMVDYAVRCCGCKRIILAGSQAEYGPHNGLINESTTINPNTTYGKYKNKLYETLKDKYKDIVVIDARIFSSYGPFQDDRNMIPLMIGKMLKNELCEFTDATQLWNYIYIEDIAEIFAKLCTIKTKSTCINLASDDTRVLKDFILEMVNLTKTKSEIKFGVKKYNTSGFLSLNPDITKLKTICPDFKFTPFSVGIKNIIKTYK